MRRRTDLLIVGAGPFGLAMAAWAGANGLDYVIAGKPMGFWKDNMPAGMLLRSATDWHLVKPLAERTLDDPGWYRRLSPDEQEALGHRFWAEGRLKIEPWLESRVRKKTIAVWPRTEIAACEERPGGDLRVRLEPHQILDVDHIILATGYATRIDRVGFLRRGNILPRLEVRDGFPVLDEHFETSVPNLFITSMAASQAFGPFVAFTLSARLSATLIGRAIAHPKQPQSAQSPQSLG